MLHSIDTRHGTDNNRHYSNGNTLPITGVPFGMNYFCLQTTSEQGSWWFHPHHRTVQGIRLTHQPSPWMGDFSHLLLSPVAGSLSSTDLLMQQGSYKPEEAACHPHYLSYYHIRYRIRCELAPSTYGAHLRMTYHQPDKEKKLLLTLPGRFAVRYSADDHCLKGHIINYSGCEDPDFKMYIAMQCVTPASLSENGQKADELQGENGSVMLTFADSGHVDEQQVTVILATSFISQAQADLNLARLTQTTFDEQTLQAERLWLNQLEKITVTDRDKSRVDLFYQMLYRCFLFPQKMYELDAQNRPIHYDTFSKSVQDGYLYTNNGFWDTYKTVYPLFSLIAVPEYEEMLEGFLNSYRHTGFLPKWLSPDERGLMPGTLVDAVIADAAVKNIRADLMPEFLEAMLTAATTQSGHPNYGRQGTRDYLALGYVPNTYHESVNHTQDYAYSDFCIGQVASSLGKQELAEAYYRSSQNYRHLVSQESGLMRSKTPDGNFSEPFRPTSWGKDYTEGSAWQNSFAVFHDFQGLIEAHGGEAAFTEHLTELCNTPACFEVGGYGFEIHEMSEFAAFDFGQIAISNQPSFHLPYLFHYVKQPHIGSHLLKELMTRAFHHGYDGYPGDEDNGSMSGWFIFNSLGFYPVTPGSAEYVLGIPLFDEAVIHLSNGNHLNIKARQNVPQYHYVKRIHRNQTEHSPLFVTHDDLMTGGTLTFELCLVPQTRPFQERDLPFSLTSRQ